MSLHSELTVSECREVAERVEGMLADRGAWYFRESMDAEHRVRAITEILTWAELARDDMKHGGHHGG